MSKGFVVIVVGEMGTGKTTYLKSKIVATKKPSMVYALVPDDFGKDFKHENVYTQIRPFISDAIYKSDTLFIVDEAKTAFSHKEPDVTKVKDTFGRDLLVWLENSRKFNNAIFISFKMLRDVPLWLLGYTSYFVRFQSNDQIQFQLNRFSSFPQIVKSLQDYPTMEKFTCDEIKIR